MTSKCINDKSFEGWVKGRQLIFKAQQMIYQTKVVLTYPHVWECLRVSCDTKLGCRFHAHPRDAVVVDYFIEIDT